MVSSLSTLSSSISTSFNSASSATTKLFGVIQSPSLEEKIPLTSNKEVEKRLASLLAQVQQNQIRRLDLTSASLGRFYELANTFSGHKKAVCCLTVLKNSAIATGSWDSTIKVWDLISRSCYSVLDAQRDWVQALVVLANGQLASGSNVTAIKLWDLASNTCLSTLQGHTEAVWALAALPDGQLVSGSDDTTIKLWDLSSNTCISTLQGHTDAVWALVALPNGQLASGSWDKTIKIWDLGSRSCLSTLQGHTWVIYALALLPDGQLASGSWDKTIKIWDLTSYSCLSTLQGHAWGIYALAVLPNGLLASGAADNTIKLWDLVSRSCLTTLQGHTDLIYALSALPNGQLVSASADTSVRLWEPKTLSAKYLSSILNALKDNTSVTDLDLSGNRDILDNLIDPLIAIFTPDTSSRPKPNNSLKTIDLRKTGVSKKGVKELEKAIQHQRLSIEVLSDCYVGWMMIYFLIIFCRANRNSPFADSGLDLCKHGEIGPFLGVPCGFLAQPRKNSASSKMAACSPI